MSIRKYPAYGCFICLEELMKGLGSCFACDARRGFAPKRFGRIDAGHKTSWYRLQHHLVHFLALASTSGSLDLDMQQNASHK